MRRPLAALALAGLLPLAGCASVRVEDTGTDLRALVQERSGERVEWRGVTAPADAVDRDVDALLDRPLDADGAATVALLTSPRVQAGFAALGRAAAERTRAGLPRNPLVEVVAKFEDGGGRPQLELSIVQEFLDLLMLPARRRLAAVTFESERLALASEIVANASRARTAFLRYQAEAELLALDRTALEAAEVAWLMAGQLREAGNIREVDLLAERDRYETTRLATAGRELAVITARERVNAVLGLWGERGARWTAEPLAELPDEEPAPADLERLAVARSLAVRRALLGVEAAARRLGVTRVEAILPELEVGVEAERETETDADGGLEDVWWRGPSVAFRLPLFDAGGPARTAATMEIRRAWELLAAEAIATRAAARETAATLAHTRARARVARDVLLPVRAALSAGMQLQFNAMAVDVFRLLETKQREIDAEREVVRARRDGWLARNAARELEAGGRPAAAEMGGDADPVGGATTREEGH